jgi:hypothetical protein
MEDSGNIAFAIDVSRPSWFPTHLCYLARRYGTGLGVLPSETVRRARRPGA